MFVGIMGVGGHQLPANAVLLSKMVFAYYQELQGYLVVCF